MRNLVHVDQEGRKYSLINIIYYSLIRLKYIDSSILTRMRMFQGSPFLIKYLIKEAKFILNFSEGFA